jgi:methylase of polypeptide subunit release factors
METENTKELDGLLEELSQAQSHPRIEVDIELIPGHRLNDFVVEEGVLRPDIVTARYLASYLFCNNGRYNGRRVWDIGCGSGIQGIVTAFGGAEHVILSDNNQKAVQNTRKNIERYRLQDNTDVYCYDLFGGSTEVVDVLLFNHPFFSKATHGLEGTIVDNGKLIHSFLSKAPAHLSEDGLIIMPYCHIAGPVNNPIIRAGGQGYTVTEVFSTNSALKLNPGKISIYELRR